MKKTKKRTVVSVAAVLLLGVIGHHTYKSVNYNKLHKTDSGHPATLLEQSLESVTEQTQITEGNYSHIPVGLQYNVLSGGGIVVIHLPKNLIIQGNINTVRESVENSVSKPITRIGGDFKQGKYEGTFAYSITEDGVIEGIVLMPLIDKAYVLNKTEHDQKLLFTEVSIDSVVCHKQPGVLGEGVVSTGTVTTGTVTTSTVTTGTLTIPKLSSRPSAKVHLYLKFNGAVVQDPLWYGGKLIVAAPATLNAAQIKDVWSLVSQRYSAFNVNITTDEDCYDNAKPGFRMRAVITPTDKWLPGWGGYAYIGSLKTAGMGIYTPNIPCFVFTNNLGNSVKCIGEATAHELGHTLGLFHDGTRSLTYYSGQGVWAPIMGSAYSKSVVQFSKGEYNNSNNAQDDITTITSNPNIGIINTNSNQNAPINLSSNINVEGVICKNTDARYYAVTVTQSGSLTINVTTPMYSGLNTSVEVLDSQGVKSLAKNNPVKDLNSKIVMPVTPGIYRIKVYGEGEGDYLTGYTSYGSIGTFIMSGTIVSSQASASVMNK